MDFSAYIQSEWSWVVMAVMAVFVDMSKTGVQGLAILTVPLLAMTFGAFYRPVQQSKGLPAEATHRLPRHRCFLDGRPHRTRALPFGRHADEQ